MWYKRVYFYNLQGWKYKWDVCDKITIDVFQQKKRKANKGFLCVENICLTFDRNEIIFYQKKRATRYPIKRTDITFIKACGG